MVYVLSFLVAMVVTTAFLPFFIHYAARWGIVDRPAARKVHVKAIPRIGGLAMVLGVTTAAAVAIPLVASDLYFLAAALVLTVFGVLDDRVDLDYRIKLVGQMIAVLLVVIGGDVRVQFVTLDDRLALPSWLSMSLSVVFLVGITNAINLADGLDGLAGGTTFLCLGAIAMLAHGADQVVPAAFAMAFAGAVLGFLRFNTFPASVFMGDAGSQLLGFAVGVLSLRATQNAQGVISAATPVLLLAMPILDTLSVTVQRVAEGRSPFSADKNHIHHKLLKLGFDHHEAVMVVYAIQADLFLVAFWMRFESDLTILAVVTVFFVTGVGLLTLAARHRWQFRSPEAARANTPLARIYTKLREPSRLPRWSYCTVAIAVGAYAVLILYETASLSDDVQWLLIALLAVIGVLLAVLRAQPLSVVEKATLYVTIAVLVYLDAVVLPPHRDLTAASWVAIVAAAIGTTVRLRTGSDRRFVFTPLDLIVLFAALVVPSLTGSFQLPDGGALGIAKLVILFYSIEILVSRAETSAVWLRLATASVLAGLVLRPLLSL